MPQKLDLALQRTVVNNCAIDPEELFFYNPPQLALLR